ncbi:hypothetical protein [Ferrimonas gelatinilytica]|uniref:DUF4231 domain-containing protein n=1 Tax=Ferrimonas gelatinilytica TaxID=1255257 RepID=A0ABP9RVL0_9GAMM
MTEQQKQHYFALAQRYNRLQRWFSRVSLEPTTGFDRLCRWGFTLAAMSAGYLLGEANVLNTLLLGAGFIITVELLLKLFRFVLSRYSHPLYQEMRVGFHLAHDAGWQAQQFGEAQCPFDPDCEEQAAYAKQWQTGYRRAKSRAYELQYQQVTHLKATREVA